MAGSGGIRSLLNNSPIGGAAVILVIIGLAVAIWMFTRTPVNHGNYFYTMDDGKTWFAAPVRVTPYTKDGKEVVEAKIFQCDGKEFVGYLRRYPENVRDRVAKQFAQAQPGLLPPSEVKRPGDQSWTLEGGIGAGASVTSATDVTNAVSITQPKCPDGKFAVPVTPPR